MKLDDIQLYIDSGWRTIPYDSISYDEDGKKHAVPKVPWKKYKSEFNTVASPAGALICGDIIVVDCDTVEAAQTIIDIAQWPGVRNPSDLLNEGVDDLIGLVVKTTRGYHFYFEGDPEIDDAKGPKIDVQATSKKLVYLASTASEGKKIIAVNKIFDGNKSVIRLHPMPKALKHYIVSLKDSREEQQARKTVRYTGGAPLVKLEKGSKVYYKRMTPRKFREVARYRQIIDERGYLMPDDVQDGDGNEYLISVAGILASDPTIDLDAFWENMEFINDQWTSPLSRDALTKKVQAYAEGKYSDCPFNYDEDWEKAQYSFEDVDGREIILAYELSSSKYIVAELDSGRTYMKNSSDIATYYANRTGHKLSAANLATMLPGVKTLFDPLRPFGLYDTKEFNTYRHSKYLDLLNEEASYTREEIEDSKTCLALPFFEHLFKEQAEYFLRFLKRKLSRFEYSATTFCLFDIEGGAGKGALETFLGYFVGQDKVVRIDYESFKSKFTSDLEGKLFIFLNEFPDDYKQRKANTDRIKDMTGSPVSKIERKGLDPYEAPNYVTYMITSNRVSVEIKEGDRRFCVVHCDKKFDNVFEEGYFRRMTTDEELSKLAVYLKHEIKELTHKDYMQPPMSLAKEAFQESNETGIDEVLKAMVKQDWDVIAGLDRDILIPHHDIIDLKKLAEALGLPHLRGLSKQIRTINKLKDLGWKIDYDRNHKFRTDTVLTYVQFKKGSMQHIVGGDLSKASVESGGLKI